MCEREYSSSSKSEDGGRLDVVVDRDEELNDRKIHRGNNRSTRDTNVLPSHAEGGEVKVENADGDDAEGGDAEGDDGEGDYSFEEGERGSKNDVVDNIPHVLEIGSDGPRDDESGSGSGRNNRNLAQNGSNQRNSRRS